jgi:AAHS family benzoate transporter-like MFS transporter
MFSGYPLGGMVAALLGKGLIDSHGWQSVFLAAGFPVLLIPLIFKSLPESIPYLYATGRLEDVKTLVARIDPSYSPLPTDQLFLPAAETHVGAPVIRLFRDGRGFSTVMLWIANFMCLFMIYALSSWLAKLMANAGYSLGSALTFVLVLNGGAIIGSILGGRLADRFHIKQVLIAMCLLAAISITLLGYQLPTMALFVVVGLAGASTIGTQIVSNAYAGQYYPSAIRATGLGWALGIGRGGAILAPIIIGVLVSMDLPLRQNFLAMALPGLVALVAILLTGNGRTGAMLGASAGVAGPEAAPEAFE